MLYKTSSHEDVNHIISLLAQELKLALGEQVISLYLTGSLTYGDFDRNSSDIDFVVVLEKAMSSDQVQKIREIHREIEETYPEWSRRIECSYIARNMLLNTEPPVETRPYVNEGKIWDAAPYGYEWLLNLYALYVCGITIFGPRPTELIKPIDINLVREASRKDFFQEWVPRLNGPCDFFDSHRQVYAVFTFCRILHRKFNDEIASKKSAASWVKEAYGEPWVSLINKSENWQVGKEMNELEQVLIFLKFTMNQINEMK